MRRWVLVTVVCGCGVLLGACNPSSTLTSTGAAQAPREPNCDFPLLTVPPAQGFVEIGAIDFTQGIYGHMYSEVTELKQAIRADVCKAGGDAAFALANGTGDYIKVTVLKRDPTGTLAAPAPLAAAAPAAGVATPTPVPAASAVPAAPADLGCHYDTQCKGDRICSDGKCVPPSATPKAGPAAK